MPAGSPLWLLCCVGALSITSSIALPAQAAKPLPATPDPCASTSPSYEQNWAGFPAFAYIIQTNQTNKTPSSYEVRLGSKNGVCSRRVGGIEVGRAGETSFARNGADYVIAWVASGGNAMVSRFESTLAVPGATAIPATAAVFRNGVNSLDLAPDAGYLVYTSLASYPDLLIRVADLLDIQDATGASDALIQAVQTSGLISLWWAPWDKIYYNPMDAASGKRILALDPLSGSEQEPVTLLTLPAIGPMVVNTLFQVGRLSGGVLSGTPAVVFQGFYVTGVKMNGASGSWCVAAYAVDANANDLFLIGSLTAPNSIGGFEISVTLDSTVLFQKSSAPTSGSSCNRTGYLGEARLTVDSAASVLSQVPGSWPAALKQ